MKPHVDMDKIARGLRAERTGKVSTGGGYFGAMQLLAAIETRFRVPVGGGRATDPQKRGARRRTNPSLIPSQPSRAELVARLRELSSSKLAR
jgi:hypothetical protein